MILPYAQTGCDIIHTMKKILLPLLSLLSGFLILYGCLSAGRAVASLLPFAFPGSIVGLLLLFVLLEAGLVRMKWILPFSSILLKYMGLLFLPAAVGIIRYLGEVYASMGLILFNIFAGIFLILLAVGRLFQHLSETPLERQRRRELYRRASRMRRRRALGAS